MTSIFFLFVLDSVFVISRTIPESQPSASVDDRHPPHPASSPIHYRSNIQITIQGGGKCLSSVPFKIKPALQADPYLDITKCALHCMMGDDVAPELEGLRNKRSRDESWE